jgi:hypothetical protein
LAAPQEQINEQPQPVSQKELREKIRDIEVALKVERKKPNSLEKRLAKLPTRANYKERHVNDYGTKE